MPEKKAPTLRDVALSAGVSPFTVSVVLNGSRSNTRVSEATRRRIEETAATLRYHPNAVARSLARRCTNTLGVFVGVVDSVTALANPYASAILQGIVTRASRSGYDVLLYTEPWQGAARSAARFRDRRSDGVVLVAPLMDTDIVSALAALDLPIVAISAAPDHTPDGTASADVDNALGIRLAVEHLWELGHRRIAHLTGEGNVASVPLRRAAFQSEMMRQGISTPAEYIVSGTYDGHAVAASLRTLLDLPQPPTAIVAGNDNIAIAVMETARELGISIPRQLSVVGFDDISAASQGDPEADNAAPATAGHRRIRRRSSDGAAEQRAARHQSRFASAGTYRAGIDGGGTQHLESFTEVLDKGETAPRRTVGAESYRAKTAPQRKNQKP